MALDVDIDLKNIVKAWLKYRQYDGLYNADIECGCLLDDLMPCDSPSAQECLAGYKHPCDCGDHDWHVGAYKNKEEET